MQIMHSEGRNITIWICNDLGIPLRPIIVPSGVATKIELTPSEVAQLLRQIPSAERQEASRVNGTKPVKPGSRKRGRPRKNEAPTAK